MPHVLIVEDDQRIRDDIVDWLLFQGYTVDATDLGKVALEFLRTGTADVVILDWKLPDTTGIEICEQYRAEGGKAPIIMLTAKDDIRDKEAGFTSGVDDYLTKPFQMRELSARLGALLRRSPNYSENVLKVGRYVLDPNAARFTIDGIELKLQKQELALLEFMMRRPGRVISVETLMRRLWADDEISTEAVYTCIRRLRRKLAPNELDSPIKTVHKLGYKFEE